ncbi:PKD domain-containing protein [Halosegnis marinus]|uniref:PKD domain-containing protein n=1 Tax=Halosegnis marinus TaxID=3034023 RepID=UPI00361E6DC3
MTVTVTDDDGAARSDTLYVAVEAPPEGPSVSLSGETTPTVGERATYTAAVAAGDAPVASVTWSLDGQRLARRDTGTGPDTLSRAFDSSVPRTLTVTVRDENGRTATDTLDVTPAEPTGTPSATAETNTDPAPTTSDSRTPEPAPSPSLTLDGPTTVLAGDAADYTATTGAIPDGAAIRWDGAGSGTRVTRTWATAGTYTVSASTSARGETASDTLTVEVLDPSLEIEGPTELHAGMTGTFAVQGNDVPDGATLSWDDGGTGATVSRTWTEPGNYTLTVTTTVRGRVVSDTHTVEVVLNTTDRNDPPRVDIRDPGDISPGEEVTLTAEASDSDGRVVDVEWTPGRTVTVPEAGGDIVVVVNVTDDDGASASDRIRLSTTEGGSIVRQTDVRCFYTAPSQRERNAPPVAAVPRGVNRGRSNRSRSTGPERSVTTTSRGYGPTPSGTTRQRRERLRTRPESVWPVTVSRTTSRGRTPKYPSGPTPRAMPATRSTRTAGTERPSVVT